jgi:hypothetical protein
MADVRDSPRAGDQNHHGIGREVTSVEAADLL